MKTLTRSVPLAALAVAVAAPLSQAAVIAVQGFEGAGGWNYAISGTGGAVSSTSLATDYPAGSRIRNGSFSYQSTNGTSVLTFDSLSIAGGEGAAVDIRLAAISATSGNGLDANDFVNVYIALDGAAFGASPDLQLIGAGNSRWSYTSGTAHAVVNVGTPATPFTALAGDQGARGYSWLTLNLPTTASSFAMKIESISASGEIWAFDDIAVTVPEPAVLGMASVGVLALMRRRRSQA